MHGGEIAECIEDGNWVFDVNFYDDDLAHNEMQKPICQLITCKDPPEIKNGEYTKKDYSYGDAVNYSCLEGFELVENTSGPMFCTGNKSTSEVRLFFCMLRSGCWMLLSLVAL